VGLPPVQTIRCHPVDSSSRPVCVWMRGKRRREGKGEGREGGEEGREGGREGEREGRREGGREGRGKRREGEE